MLRTIMVRGKRTLIVLAAAIAGLTGMFVLGQAPANALGAGTVCMFNAPTGASWAGVNLGHVGWAFREGPTDHWFFGASESSTNSWQDDGDQNAMFDAFEGHRGHGISQHYYTKWRCKSTPGSSVGAALNMVGTVYNGRPLTNVDNCLTRSIRIFKAYDSSLGNLSDGKSIAPNYYFDTQLLGFGPVHTSPLS